MQRLPGGNQSVYGTPSDLIDMRTMDLSGFTVNGLEPGTTTGSLGSPVQGPALQILSELVPMIAQVTPV